VRRRQQIHGQADLRTRIEQLLALDEQSAHREVDRERIDDAIRRRGLQLDGSQM